MMYFSSAVLISLALKCPMPQFQNKTNYPLNEFDKSQMARASYRWAELYKNSPCLKQFVKIDKQDYRAVCGSK